LSLRNRSDLCDALLNARGGLQEYLDDSYSVQRLRFDVLDIVDRSGERSLCDANDPVSHVLRYEPVVTPDNADNRNIDIGKDIGRGAKDGERTHDQDKYGQHHKGIGPLQCKSDDPHRISSPFYELRTA